MDLSFWSEIEYSQIRFTWRVEQTVTIPAYLGTSLRGALGYKAKAAWCQRRPACEETCQAPASCRFARWYGETDTAGDLRPFVLKPPIPDELLRIIYGSAPEAPFVEDAPQWQNSEPRLSCDQDLVYREGAEVKCEMVLIGNAMDGLKDLVAECRDSGLAWRRGLLSLSRVEDVQSTKRIVWDRMLPGWWGVPSVHTLADRFHGRRVERLRVLILTPTRTKAGESGRVTLSGRELSSALFEKCLVRTVQLHNALFPEHERLPRVEIPSRHWRVAATRLFHYVLPRTSRQQSRDMQYDGLVGSIDYEGELTELSALVRAAEILHIGQKATAGLGWLVSFES